MTQIKYNYMCIYIHTLTQMRKSLERLLIKLIRNHKRLMGKISDQITRCTPCKDIVLKTYNISHEKQVHCE